MRKLVGVMLASIVGVGSLVATAPAASAKDIARIPVCDLDGHCDRHCVVSTTSPYLRCGYGP